MGKVKDFKFGVRIDRPACKPTNAKVGQKWCGLCHVSYCYNFWTLCVSLKWEKLETNLVQRLTAGPTNQKMLK